MRPPRPFPEGSVEQLEQAFGRVRSKAGFQRVQCVWLRAVLGLNANQVAQAVGWQPSSVRRLQAQFWRQGKALWERPGRGGRRHQNLTREEEGRLSAALLDLAARCLASGRVLVHKAHGCPFRGEESRRGPANAAGRARD